MAYTYHSTTCNFDQYCIMGHKHHLYEPYGAIQNWLNSPKNIVAMASAYSNDIPIGMAILMKDMSDGACSRFGVFVRNTMRRQGIGTQLVALIKKRSGQRFMVCKWSPEQIKFMDTLYMKGYRNT